MTWRWTESCWNALNLELAHAVYEAVRKESPVAPMTVPLGPGNVLLRSFDREHVGAGTPDVIVADKVLESIRVRDAKLDRSRFSGSLPAFGAKPGVVPKRGGLYCSEDIRAAIAELFEYSDSNLARNLIGRPERMEVFTRLCFVSVRPVRELNVVNLESGSTAMLPFFARIERNERVAKALAQFYLTVSHHREKDLFHAIYREDNYSAARGLGLGLESNPEVDGIRVISARDYGIGSSEDPIMRTGDNVVLFGLDGRFASDKVKVHSMHLVDRMPDSAKLRITNYGLGSGGMFRKGKTPPPFMP